MTTTTSYGTWTNQVSLYSTSPESNILDYINGGGSDWCQRLEETGAFDRIAAQYRAAINNALPPEISLCGEEFIGPAHPEDGEFDDYPQDEHGMLDLAAIVEEVDLAAIVEYWDPDGELTLEEVANEIGASSTGSARKTLSRWQVQAVRREPGRGGQSIYNAYEVRAARADRPGQGTRTDLRDSQ